MDRKKANQTSSTYMDLKFYVGNKTAPASLLIKMIAAFIGCIIYTTDAAAQTPATALNFDGVSNYVSVPVSASLNISSNITLEAWVNYSKNFGTQDVVCKSASNASNSYVFPRTSDGWETVEFLLYLNGQGWKTLNVSYSGIRETKRYQWHHLAATYDGYYMRIYIDGVLAGSQAAAGAIAVNNNPLIVGGQTGFQDEYFGGSADDIRVWNRALSACEISSTMNCELDASSQTGLAAYYKLNQGFVNQSNTGVTTMQDETANANNGRLSGFLLNGSASNWTAGTVSGTCPAFTPVVATAGAVNNITLMPVGSNIQLTASGGDTYSWVGPNGFTSTQQNPVIPGAAENASGVYTVTAMRNGCSASANIQITVAQPAKAISFDGSNDLIRIPNSPSFNSTSALTLEMWIKPNSSLQLTQNVLTKSTFNQNNGFIFPRTDDGWRSFSFWLAVNGQWKVISAQFTGVGQWTHVAATYDGFFMKIYMNGNLVGSLSAPGTITTNVNDVFIGQQEGFNNEYYNGGVDEMRVWSRALSQCEIQNNQNCELNGANNGLASLSGLSAYYRFNQGLVNVDNTAYTVLADSSINHNNGTLLNFILNGANGSNWTSGGNVNNSTCSPYQATLPVAGSNGPVVEVGTTIQLNASSGTSYAWTGPLGFTSTLQNPAIPNSTVDMTGTYTVSITNNGCTSVTSTKLQVAYRAGTLKFDGVDDYVRIPRSNSMNMSSAITMEAWVYPTNNMNAKQDVMSKSRRQIVPGDNLNTGYIFPRTDDGWKSYVFYLHLNGAWQQLAAPYPAINEWHHLAATYDGYYMRIYIDGALSASRQIVGTITQNDNDLVLGWQEGFSTEHFEGKVDEARLWNRALNQCEIMNNMSCELDSSARNGLVAYYKFNQGFVNADNTSLTSLHDESINANNGTLQNFALTGINSNWSDFKISGTCQVFSLPPVTATANGTVFGVGSTIKLFASGGFNYTWDGPNSYTSTDQNPTILNAQTNQSGVYTVTAPFVKCVVTASTKLSVSALSPIQASGPTTFCPSGSVTLSTPNTGISYQWYKDSTPIVGATAQSYVATASGNYTVSVKTGGDVVVAVPVSVTVQDNLPPQPTVASLPVLQLKTPATVSPGDYPTAMDNCAGLIKATTQSVTTFNDKGNFVITWKYDDLNGHVVYQDQQVVVTIGIDVIPPVLTVPANMSLPGDLNVCGAVASFAATATDNSGDPVTITYSQNPGTIFPVGTTTVQVTAADKTGNIATGSFTITVSPTVVSPITGNTIICAGATTALTTTSTGGNWSSADTRIATVDASGTVTGVGAGNVAIIYTNACGATASLTVTVNAVPSAPVVTVTDNCGTSTLSTNASGSLLWSTNETTVSITVANGGTYSVTQRVNGCVSNAGSAIAAPKAIPSAPVVTVTDNCGASTLSTNAPGSLLWNTNETTSSVTVSNANTYTVTQTVNGCISAAGSGIAAPRAVPSAPVVVTANNCGNAVLSTTATGTLLWNTGETTSSITASAAGAYTVTQTVNGCTSAPGSGQAVPKVIPATPVISVVNNCGYSVLTANANGSLLWSNGATTPSVTITNDGAYSVTITTVDGCSTASAASSVTVNRYPVVPAITGTTTTTVTSSTQLNNGVAGGNWISSNTGIAAVDASGLVTGIAAGNATINYMVTSAAGCSTTVSAAVLIKPNCIPPALSVQPDITAATSVTGCTAQVNYNVTVTGGNPAPSLSYIFNGATSGNGAGTGTGAVFNKGMTTVKITAVNACGTAVSAFAVIVNDSTAPVVTAAVPAQSFCAGAAGYTVPVLSAADNCGSVSVSYVITGATNRTGTNNNASGSFGTGVSTITWTVKDQSGNTTTSNTSVTVYAVPVAGITASSPDDFCNKLALNGASTVDNASFSWSYNNAVVLNGQQLRLGLTDSDGNYQLIASANGCASTPVSYNFQKQNFAGSYTILVYDDAGIGKYNKVASGSIGALTTKSDIRLRSYSSVSGAGAFVKGTDIRKDANAVANNLVYGVATVTLPAMQYNTASTRGLSNYTAYSSATLTSNYSSLTVKRNVSVIVTGNTFGTIHLEDGASIRFTAPVLNIENLIVDKGIRNNTYSYVRFAPNSSVRVSTKASFGSEVIVNPDAYKVTFYMGDQKCDNNERFSVKGCDTKIIANVLMPSGRLTVNTTDANNDLKEPCNHQAHSALACPHLLHDHNYCDHKAHNAATCFDNVNMTGLFIVEDLDSKGNIVIWNSYDCANAAPIILNGQLANQGGIITQETNAKAAAATETAAEDLKVVVMPNPSTTFFTLKFTSRSEMPLNIRVMDAAGRIVDAKSKLGANSTIQIGHTYSSGTYYAEITQGGQRKVIQLIKARG